MALINFAQREIEVKIVFYGPAYSGKTTNVEILHRLMPPTQRGELHSLRTEQDRTLFFDYVPVKLGEIAGFTARFKLFTVPGQIFYKETRRVVLQGADAVVFVADSSPDRMEANLEALVDLEDNLRAHGLDLHSIPLVIQLNKRDIPGALPADEMAAELNPFEVPVIEAVAAEGRGVLDTLRRITDIAGQRIRENLSGQATAVALTAVERDGPEDERNVVRDQLDAIRKVRPGEDAAVRSLLASGKLHAGQVDAVLSELVVRSEDVTPPEPLEPMDGPLDEMPVPRDHSMRGLMGPGYVGQPGIGGEVTPVHRAAPPQEPPGHAAPLGPPLVAWIDAPGARVTAVSAGTLGPDGETRFEILAETEGELFRHVVTWGRGPAPVRAAAAEAPPATGAIRWAAFGGATVFTAVAAMTIGVALGWIAFSG